MGVGIWLRDGRYLALGGLALIASIVCGVTAAYFASPETLRRASKRKIEHGGEEG